MKHNYTPETIQTAIDAACASDNVAEELHTSPKSRWWECQAEFRLNLARGLLARLPSPAASQDSQPAEAEIPWTEWHGGPCPLNDDEVEEWEIKFRDSVIDTNPSSPQRTRWHYHGTDGDIIAYRVLKWKKPEPLVTNLVSSPEWTPAVGDLVQLKSGGPVMVVEYVKEDEADVVWINSIGDMRRNHGLPSRVLNLPPRSPSHET